MPDGENGKIYARLNEQDRRIAGLEAARPFLQDLIERNTRSYEDLSQTMQGVQLSMVKMNEKIDAQSKDIVTLKEGMVARSDSMAEKINAIEIRVANIDDEGKFNIRTYLRTNWPLIIVLIGMGAMYATQFVKF